ncbi:unnamed protein product, partial [Prorocentrum cordatum]
RRAGRGRELPRGAAAVSRESPAEKAAVVVGAGPAGLAAALLLEGRGWSVTVVERSADPTEFDPGRGFMYLIDGRGQRCLEGLEPGLLERLRAASVEAAAADIGIVSPEGLREMANPMKNALRTSYWLPRKCRGEYGVHRGDELEN